VSQGEFVAAAYGVVFVALLVYVAIIAAKLARLERETAEIAELARKRTDVRAARRPGAARLRGGGVRLRR
jgi:CcmD family protein